MYCDKCGNNISKNTNFCNVCGNKIEKVELTDITQQKNKSYAWIFIVLGVLIGLIAMLLIIFSISKFSNKPIKELEDSLTHFILKSKNSGTINLDLSIQTNNSDKYDFNANIKYIKKHNDNYDIAFKIDKTNFNEEINIFSKINNKTITLYASSNLIDMLGLTESTDNMWVYYKDKNKILENFDIEDDRNFNFFDVIDDAHYKFINEEKGLKHYKLTIDNELLNKLKSQTDSEFVGFTELNDVYYLDIYINNKGELTKLELDLTKFINEKEIKKALITIQFYDLGSTSLTIPMDAINSSLNLETYLSKFSLFNSDVEEESTNDIYYNNYDAYLKGDYYNPKYYYAY
ncbi:MAG: zinc ribbon domain-containing protein [Bacilli bacterium]|nr:zinc ribbon domain-containing protein [Bacilli bacterium]